jgi:hypothetical protein
MKTLTSSHILNKHSQVKLTTSRHHVLISRLSFLNSEGDVTVQLLKETITDHSTGEELALAASKRRFVDSNGHAHSRLLDSNRFQWRGGVGACIFVGDNSVSNLDFVETGKHDNLTGTGFFDFFFTEVIKDKERSLKP